MPAGRIVAHDQAHDRAARGPRVEEFDPAFGLDLRSGSLAQAMLSPALSSVIRGDQFDRLAAAAP